MNQFKERLIKWNFKKIGWTYVVVALITIGAGAVLSAPIRQAYWESVPPAYSQMIGVQGEDGPYAGNERYERLDRSCHRGYRAHGRVRSHVARRAFLSGLSGTDRAVVIGLAAAGGLLFLSLRVLLVLWTAQMALKTGMQPVLWGLVAAVFHLFGILAFFLVRGLRNRCPACGMVQAKDAEYCTNCGAPLQAACPHCGGKGTATDHYCRHCGERLD